MSACASAFSVVKDRNVFTTMDIDTILESGDALYLRSKPECEIFLLPEELPSEFRVGRYSVRIQCMDDSWMINALFPNCTMQLDVKLLELEIILRDTIFNNAHQDNSDSYLFTGHNYTVSFWRFNGGFFLFNSHAVGETNVFDRSERNNRARLFRCESLKSLARLLFSNHVYDGQEYSINQIRVLDHSDMEVSVVSSDRSSVVSHLSITKLQPVVILTRMDLESTVTVAKKRGRPQKRKNRSSSEIIAKKSAVGRRESCDVIRDPKLNIQPVVVLKKIEIEQYIHKNIDATEINDPKLKMKPVVVLDKIDINSSVKDIRKILNREAVKRYTRENPSVNRRAVKRYSQNKPSVNQNAVKRYTQVNPDVHRRAVRKYTEEHPDVHREAAGRYADFHPEVNREAVKRYTETHREVGQASVERYNAVRNIEPDLRRSDNLIGQKHGDELGPVKLFSLKNTLNNNTFRCVHCHARLFIEEKSRQKWCCGSGAYNVQHFEPLSEDFYSHPLFLERARAYNNLFAFSALGVSHGFQHPDTGIYFIKIQGRIYHRVFDLAYTDSTNPISLYIHDSEERERIAIGQNLDLQIIRSIRHFMDEVNPYINCFRMLSREESHEAHLIFEPTSRRTHGNILGDMPVGAEVAAIMSTERERFIPKAIVVWKIGAKKPHTVDLLHPLYETFQFPLLYPHGNPGWLPNKLDNRGSKLTQNKYVKCLLLSEERFSEIGRLSEEWIVDMFCRISEERLRYISNMQNSSSNNSLRTAPLQELQRNVELLNDDETIQGEGGTMPGRIYLPNSFTGGPRYMKTKYMDAIALVNRLGTPSFFLTMTCNPKWPEIQQSIPQGQRPNPLVCARVFNLKLAQLLRDLRTGAWFGKCVYIMHVIEFQKRGLPHAHICFRVGGGPVQNSDIDTFIRADLPDPTEADGRLRKAVINHMIHGPCGPPHRTNLPCWDKDKEKCTKFFPKQETTTTFCDDRGFVHLRRNSQNVGTIKYRGRDVTISDLWVVPYNAALLLKYDCHINLLVYSARAIVKYLFKYMTKGPDESRITVVPEVDKNNEIEQYVTKRYLGSCEATWRILEFDITAREPNVKQLAVHLAGQQSIFFKPGTEAEATLRATSDLLTYFNRPSGVDFDRLTYLDFYEQFIVHPRRPTTKNVEIYELGNGKFVTRRQRGELVARLFWVAPNRGEQFYLRLLLASQPCRGYDDLYRLGGANCTTFQEAAKALGIANDELEYEVAVEEASTFLTGPRLRSFFVLLAVNGIRVAALWEKFKHLLSQDFLQRLPENESRAYALSLISIDRLMRRHGTSLVEQGLPEVEDDTTEVGRERIEYNPDHLAAFVAEWSPRLSVEQSLVYDYVDKLLRDESFRDANDTALFVDGPAGTGKTLLLNVITAHVRGDLNGIVLCTATSGIAAQNYEGGVTAHSMFRFPLNLVDDLGYWNITNGSERAELIYHANVIIYDEAPMAHKYLINLLDRSLRDLMKCDKLFGGKIIIFAGDFRQIPPVVVNAKTSSDVINCSVKSSPIWPKIKTFTLTTSQRCKSDSEFSEFLLKLGSNQLPVRSVKVGRVIQNLVDLTFINYVTEVDDLIDFVFPHVVIDEPDICAHRAILSTHNQNVREINSLILSRLPQDTLHFYSIDEVISDNADEIFLAADTLNRLQIKGVPDHDLALKIGCVCMIIRNLSFSDRLVNGSKVIVVRTSPRLITVRKPGESVEYVIPRISFKAPVEPNSPFEMMRRQFPLQVCYAMTIHKSQGQTIGRVGVDLRSDVFSHGQLYVALGRVQDRDSLKVLVSRDNVIDNTLLINNVVYPQLL